MGTKRPSRSRRGESKQAGSLLALEVPHAPEWAIRAQLDVERRSRRIFGEATPSLVEVPISGAFWMFVL